MMTDEKKRRIESLSEKEMAYEINLGRRSRFQREAFAYLQTCYEQRMKLTFPEKTSEPPTNPNNDQWYQKPIGIIWLAAIAAVLATLIIFLIKKHIGIPL
jgi:hypothetical protein